MPRAGRRPGPAAEIAGIEAAVAVHDGPPEDIDRTYGALGIAVAERAIGVDGPIREYYPDGFPTDDRASTAPKSAGRSSSPGEKRACV